MKLLRVLFFASLIAAILFFVTSDGVIEGEDGGGEGKPPTVAGSAISITMRTCGPAGQLIGVGGCVRP
jgi:hypothetical protein